MEKIRFRPSDEGGSVDFYVLEETRIGGVSYILVTDEETGDAEAFIMKDTSGGEDAEAVYMFVEDEDELLAVAKVFAEMLEDDELDYKG